METLNLSPMTISPNGPEIKYINKGEKNMKTIDLPRARKQIAEEILKRFDHLVCDILTSITSDEDISFEDRMELVDAIPYMADDVLSKIRFDIEYYKEKIENEENKEE